jgi:hypothetical protein
MALVDDEFATHEYGGVPFLQIERSVEFVTEYDPPFLHGVNEWFLWITVRDWNFAANTD